MTRIVRGMEAGMGEVMLLGLAAIGIGIAALLALFSQK